MVAGAVLGTLIAGPFGRFSFIFCIEATDSRNRMMAISHRNGVLQL